MVTVVDAIGYRKLASVKRLQESAYRAWMAGLVCSAVAGVYTLFRLQEKEKTVDRKEGEGVVEAKKIEKYVTTPRFCRDFRRLLLVLCDGSVEANFVLAGSAPPPGYN